MEVCTQGEVHIMDKRDTTGRISRRKHDEARKPKDAWALRVRLQMVGRVRETALFNLGIGSRVGARAFDRAQPALVGPRSRNAAMTLASLSRCGSSSPVRSSAAASNASEARGAGAERWRPSNAAFIARSFSSRRAAASAGGDST